jgi:hypothetical protein
MEYPFMSPVAVVLIAGGMVVGYAACDTLVTWVTRPRRLRPAPPTPRLAGDPPALANLLVNRCRVTADAAESTLVDLVARRLLELRHPRPDPRETTVHLRPHSDSPTNLAPFELQVAYRVEEVSVGGLAPITALPFRDQRRSRAWHAAFARAVAAAADELGYCRPRLPRRARALLDAVAVVAAVMVFVLTFVPLLAIGLLVLLGAAANRPRRQVLTGSGRRAAEHWLGVREWLRAHPEFRQLPPASVAVWDRYLSYGAALGVTPVTSRTINLGMGTRRTLWSSYGGRWRRVQVRYPKVLPWYGRPGGRLGGQAAWTIASGLVVIGWSGAVMAGSAPGLQVPPVLTQVRAPWFATGGGLLVAYGIVVLGLLIVDLLRPRRLRGQVLWLELWKRRLRREGADAEPAEWLYHLAVDDGRADRTTAWVLPAELADRCEAGDLVSLTVRPLTRRVTRLDPRPRPSPDRSGDRDPAPLPGS